MVSKQQRSLEFMKSPLDWPRWPLLPVKRTNPADGFQQVGTMIAVREHLTTVYFTNLWRFKKGSIMPQLEDVESKEYIDYEGVIDDGWVVD